MPVCANRCLIARRSYRLNTIKSISDAAIIGLQATPSLKAMPDTESYEQNNESLAGIVFIDLYAINNVALPHHSRNRCRITQFHGSTE